MRNIKLTIAYDGTEYGGWQIQKNVNTIQAELEKALKKILGKKVKITGAGRTDSGVHARGQVANFKTDSKLSPKTIKKALNAKLPDDIIIKEAGSALLNFNARFSAKSKLYGYTILNSDTGNPFLRKYATPVLFNLDLKAMRKASKALIGRHDFKSFQAKDVKERSSVRTIKRIKIAKNSPYINIDIEADGFLYRMARNIVGTLIEISRGYFPPQSMKTILHARDRKKAGPTAPSKGLTLLKVRY